MTMQLIIITREDIFKGEAEALNLLFEKGCHLLHIRKPSATEAEVCTLLDGIDPVYMSRIVLHDHFALADCYGVRGIHLNRRNPEYPVTPVFSLSRSCHSLEELSSIERFKYVFLSPIFDSISKSGYNRGFSHEVLTEASERGIINEKIIALGGISIQTIPTAASYGFGGVAVLGALWNGYKEGDQENALLQRFESIQNLCNQL